MTNRRKEPLTGSCNTLILQRETEAQTVPGRLALPQTKHRTEVAITSIPEWQFSSTNLSGSKGWCCCHNCSSETVPAPRTGCQWSRGTSAGSGTACGSALSLGNLPVLFANVASHAEVTERWVASTSLNGACFIPEHGNMDVRICVGIKI